MADMYDTTINWGAPTVPIPVSAAAPTAAPGQQRALARGSLQGLFRNDDYPQGALQSRAQGVVRIRLAVGPDGRVTGCAITGSSGSRHLDSATCSVLRSRARFTPARDVSGSPMTDVLDTQIAWTLPRG
jgi:protein TonB